MKTSDTIYLYTSVIVILLILGYVSYNTGRFNGREDGILYERKTVCEIKRDGLFINNKCVKVELHD